MLAPMIEYASCLMNGACREVSEQKNFKKEKKPLDKTKLICYHIKVRYGERLYLVN